MKHSSKGNIFLLTAALVWGFALVAQKAGMEHLGPFGFTAIRCMMGGVLLLPLVYFLDKKKTDEQRKQEAGLEKTVIGSCLCGVFLAALILFQQFGLPHTTVGKAGFITALYILITPIIGIFLKKKTTRNLWIGVAVALMGMYFLCLTKGLSGITYGDFMMLGAAVICSVHMHVVDHFVGTVDAVKLSSFQFIFAGLICVTPAMIFENVTWSAVVDCAIPLLYAGVISCAGGYTFQIIGQKYTNPNLASLLLSLETVFGLFAGWLVFHEILSGREYVGCVLMFLAIIISQLPERKKAENIVVSNNTEDK